MAHQDGYFEGYEGISLYYQTWIPEKATKAVMILVHGIGEYCGRYQHMADFFNKSGYQVYGFDHRGHGHSPGKRGHINNWVEFREDTETFKKMVLEMHSDVPVFLFGHSMGALISLDYLRYHSAGLKGAIISGPPLTMEVSPLLKVLSRVASVIMPWFTMETGLDTKGLSTVESVVKIYEEDPLVHPFASARFGASFEKTINDVSAHPDVFDLPLFFVHGEKDPICLVEPAKTFYEKITQPDKSIKVYHKSLHEIHNDVEQVEEFQDILHWMEDRM